MIKVIHGEIWSDNFDQLNQLIEDFSSCTRYAFSRFQKDKLSLNDIRCIIAFQYPTLNSRQRSDAILLGQAIHTRNKDNKVVFGGRKSWHQLKTKSITKQEWKNKKNNQLYSRGDKTHLGNPNLRIVDDQLRVTVGTKQFVHYKLFIPDKYQEELQWLLASGQSYNVRLTRNNATHFNVMIEYSIEDPKTVINFDNGSIGVDTNPDLIAICNVSKDGNYINSFSLANEKLLFASTNKRQYEISLLVKEVINYAKLVNKGIVFENLKFKKNWDKDKKWNRIKSNFVYRKFLTLLERKCIENGIKYHKVHPAYTSIIGRLKYKQLYNINVHQSAAYVIARRGLGYNEKLSISGFTSKKVKESVIRTHAGKYNNNRIHSWKLWKWLKDNEEAVLTGLSSSTFNLKELNDSSSLEELDELENEGEIPSSKIFLKELVLGSEKEFSSG